MKLPEFLSVADELVKKLVSEVNRNNLGLKEVEEQVLALVYQVGQELVQQIVDQVVEPTMANSIVVNGETVRFRTTDTIVLKDRFGGAVNVTRRRYGMQRGGSFYPLDDRLGLTRCHGFTPLMTWLQALFGASDPFRQAAERLSAATGITVSATAVERNTEKTGAVIENRPNRSITGRASPCELLVIEMDGTMSPQIMEIEGHTGRESLKNPTEYKECNVGIIQKQREGMVVDQWTGGLYGPRSEFHSYFQEACTKMGKLNAEHIVFITDGAKHNWEFCGVHLKKATQILDYYHATEHVAAFCESYSGDATSKKARYFYLTGLIYEGQILQAKAEMQSDQKKFRTPATRAAAQKEINYFQTNCGRMEYDRYRKMRLPIGSGMIESACKLVVGKRFKGNGMRWKKADNQNVLNTRLAVMNNSLHREFQRQPDRWLPKAC